MESYYELLEVSNKASPEVIEKAYKVLVKKYHPDLQPQQDKKKTDEMMKKINAAYDILIDENKRAEYDKKLEQDMLREQMKNANMNTNNNERPDMSRVINHEEAVTRGVDSNVKNNSSFTPDDLAQRLKQQMEMQRQAQRAYNDAYVRYMKDLGYKVRNRKTWKDTLKKIVIIFSVIYIVLIIFAVLWLIPPAKEQMIIWYNENIFIRILVNIIVEIMNAIYRLFGG